MGRRPLDDLGRILEDLFSSFRGIDRSWGRFERGLNRGDWGTAWRGLVSSGISGRKSVRVGNRLVKWVLSIIGAITGFILLLKAVITPSADNIGNAVTHFALEDIPDPVGWIFVALASVAVAIAGYVLHATLKNGRRA